MSIGFRGSGRIRRPSPLFRYQACQLPDPLRTMNGELPYTAIASASTRSSGVSTSSTVIFDRLREMPSASASPNFNASSRLAGIPTFR
jgi:hypothetical protein